MSSNPCRARRAMPIWPRGGWPPGAAGAPAGTGRCSSGGWNATACRSRRCWRGSPPCAADHRRRRRRGSMTPSGSRRRCKVPETSGAAGAAPTPGPSTSTSPAREPVAFEHLLAPVVEQAETKLWAGIGERASANLSASAQAGLRHALLKELSGLCAAALYERFGKARKAGAMPAGADKPKRGAATSQYDRFVADMKAGGLRRLFEDKPVLLRLLATITRQWIDTTREFVLRLDADLATIRHGILDSDDRGLVAGIEGELSDPHNGGHSVLIVRFEDGSRVVYKPKDLRLDVAWHALVAALEPRRRSGRAKGGARDRARRLWLDRVHRSCRLRRGGRLQAIFPAGGRLARAVPLLRRQRHAPGEHDRGGRASGADRSRNDPAGDRRGAQDRGDRGAGIRGCDGDHRQLGHDGRPAARLCAVARQQSLRDGRNELGLDVANGAHVEQHQFRHDAAREDEGDRRRQSESEPAACRRPLRQARRPYRRLRRGLRGLRQVPVLAEQGRRPGRAVRRLCRPAGPQGRSPDPVLLHAAAAAEKSPQHGRRRHLVGASRFPRQAGGLGESVRSTLAVAACRTRGAAGAECPAFRVAERRRRDPRCKRHLDPRRRRRPGLDRARARLRNFDEQDIAWQVEVIRQNTATVSRSNGTAAAAPRRKPRLAYRRGDCAAQGELPRGSRQDRRGACAHAIRKGPARSLDRSRLAGRFRGCPARAARRRSL